MKASVTGGTFDPEVNESSLLIKAATYHGLSVKKVDTHWEAAVIFDI
ncbi:MAG: archease [Nitrospirota bacterium]|nr:archease [Nitrospirota bacterium]